MPKQDIFNLLIISRSLAKQPLPYYVPDGRFTARYLRPYCAESHTHAVPYRPIDTAVCDPRGVSRTHALFIPLLLYCRGVGVRSELLLPLQSCSSIFRGCLDCRVREGHVENNLKKKTRHVRRMYVLAVWEH